MAISSSLNVEEVTRNCVSTGSRRSGYLQNQENCRQKTPESVNKSDLVTELTAYL